MSWTDNLSKIAKGVVDYTGVPGLIHDMSNMLSNEDPWYVDATNLVKDVTKIGTTPVRGAVKGLLYAGQKSYEAGGVVRQKMEETLLDTPLMYNKYKNEGETFDSYRQRVAGSKDQISLGQATLAALSPGKNAGDRSGWFADALDNNLKFMSAGFDIFNPDDRKAAFQEQAAGKFISGAEDLVASSVIDPLTFTGFLGKGAVIASKGLMADQITGKLSRVVFSKVAMTNEKMDNLLTRAMNGEGQAVKDVEFLAATDAKGQYGYWAKKKVTNPDSLAYMFGRANTKEEVIDTFRAVMLKDTQALSRIAEKDSEVALMADNLSDMPHPQRELVNGKLEGDVLVSPEYNNSIGKYIEDMQASDPAWAEAYNKVATGRPFRYGFEKGFVQEGRFGAVNTAKRNAARTFADAESIGFLKTSLHPMVKIAHFFKEDVPSGVFSVNDGNSYQEFNTFLRQTNDLSGGNFVSQSKELADEYLSKYTPNDRLDVIKKAERAAINTLFPKYDQETLDKIYKIYDGRRAALIARHNNQGFLGFFDNGQFINMKSPLLERQGANTVIIADLKRLKDGVDAHERILPTILQGIDVDNLAVRNQKTMAALDTINDIFKTSVLMRFGYTVRNLTEANLSMMAKGFALPGMVAANGKDGVARFFNNRKVGANRLADQINIMLGRADDYNVMQHEVASQMDMIRSVDKARKDLSKAIAQRLKELEKETFRLRLTGNVGPLNIDDEIKLLRGAQAELDAVTVYHGSAEGNLKLDKTRALAASTSKGVASNYTGQGTIHSVEQYIETPSGRAGRLGQKPELAPGETIGTPGVVEQMPLEEFKEVKDYVRGFYSETQQDLRDPNRWASYGKIKKAEIPKLLQRAIQRSVIRENTVVYRGTTNPDILNAKLGDIVTEKGFVSTSKEYRVAEGFAANAKIDSTIVKIQLPKGANGLDIIASYKDFSKLDSELIGDAKIASKIKIAEISGEKEVLLPAGTKFEVVNVIEGQPATGDFPEIKPVFTLRAIVEKPKLPSPKRAATIEEAVVQLRTDMIAAKNAGKKVEIKRGGSWREVEAIGYDDLTVAMEEGSTSIPFAEKGMEREVFRVGAGVGKVKSYKIYGKPLDLINWSSTAEKGVRLTKPTETFAAMPEGVRALFENKVSVYRTWVKNKGWANPDDPIFDYMRENGYGYARVPDDKRAGHLTHVALPESINERGRTGVVNRYLKETPADAGVFPEDRLLNTPAERRSALKMFNRRARLQKEEYAVSPYYGTDNIHAMINNGVEDAAAKLANDFAVAHAHLDDLMQRVGATVSRAESTSIKQRLGFGVTKQTINGQEYTLPRAFEEASWFLGRTSAEQTWNALVSSQEMAFTAGIGSRTVRTIQPTDPKYFEGWANILNMHFRDPETGVMDSVVRKILDNESDKKILQWLHTKDGTYYAKEAYTMVGEGKGPTKLTGKELDEHLMTKIKTQRAAVAAYIPDNETALMLSAAKETEKPLSGGEVQQFLLERFGKNPENLQPLNGLLVTSSKEYKDQERLIDTINRRVMRFLGSMPEDVFARHPLVSAVYEKELRLNLAAMSDAKGITKETAGLTPNEINRAVAAARETARTEVERTLFTIVRRTGASSSQTMKLLFPFFAAYENTLKRWGGMAAENPSIVSTASRTIAQVVNGQMIIDRDGNQITDATKLQGENQTANLLIQVPDAFVKALPKSWQSIVENSFKNLNIPLASLDVITQGNPGNPGFGPYATLPAYLILKDRPELENALQPFFPVGQPQSAMDIFTPSVARRLLTVWRQDELYVRSYNQMLRYETYRYNQGLRQDAPLPTEIKDKTNKFFFLRALTSISAPFAITPEVDFYAQTFRNLQAKYADYVDPVTGKRGGQGMAEAEFLKQYPDFFEATVSLSKNEGGLEPSVQTVRNLRKYSNLMALADGKGDPELMGFLANDGDNQYTFSQAAYQWQYKHGATPGAGSAYRQNRTPGDLQKEANIKRGWTEFQNLQKQITTYKLQNGIESDNDPQMKDVNNAKSIWVQAMGQRNIDWYSEYLAPDRAKYERRAQILTVAAKDKQWMAQNGDRPVVKNMLMYLETRQQIANMLKERDAAGGSRSLDANSNADIAYAFDLFKTNLKAGSVETEEFLNRYFANDTVVL
jgi:hypothetical protein